MTGKVILEQSEYSVMRIESREALNRLGIESNPGFTNSNIVQGLSDALGVEVGLIDELDQGDFTGEMFRDSLGEILGLELPPSTSEVVCGLRMCHLFAQF